MSLPTVRAASMRAAAAADRVELRQSERRLDPTLTLRGGKEDDDTLIGVMNGKGRLVFDNGEHYWFGLERDVAL